MKHITFVHSLLYTNITLVESTRGIVLIKKIVVFLLLHTRNYILGAPFFSMMGKKRRVEEINGTVAVIKQ